MKNPPPDAEQGEEKVELEEAELEVPVEVPAEEVQVTNLNYGNDL